MAAHRASWQDAFAAGLSAAAARLDRLGDHRSAGVLASRAFPLEHAVASVCPQARLVVTRGRGSRALPGRPPLLLAAGFSAGPASSRSPPCEPFRLAFAMRERRPTSTKNGFTVAELMLQVAERVVLRQSVGAGIRGVALFAVIALTNID